MSDIISPFTQQPLTKGQLSNISQLAIRQLELESEIEHLEETKIPALKDELRKLSEETLPLAMLEVGLSEFRLNNGEKTKLKLEKYYNCGLYSDEPKNKTTFDPIKRVDSFKWLKENGHGALIKTNITAAFGTGEQEFLEKVVKALTKTKAPFRQRDDVHHMTLKSFCREIYEANKTLPVDLFRVHVGNRVTIG